MATKPVRASLRRFHSPDACDLRSFRPSDPSEFGILVQAMIGPAGAEGEEAFDFILCTPRWVARELETQDFWWGRAGLVVAEYDYEALERTVLARLKEADGDDWSEVAEKLNRWMHWEFEDYRPSREP